MAKMFLVDGSNHAFRVHFALPPMHNANGFPTRALYGFTTLFAKMLRVHQPDYVVVSFDSGESFRHGMFPDYKGHRPDMPEDLKMQWPYLTTLVHAFGYKCVAVPGYEADDVLGTLAKRFAGPDLTVWLVTGDHDFFQLVDDNIRILDMMKEEELGPSDVVDKLGVSADRVVDVKGLSGDASDNIPGVPGVGEKTAVKYLQKYGTLEGVLAHADEIGGKRGQALKDHADEARLSARLATICTTCDLGALTLDDLRPKGIQEDEFRDLMDRWDFGKVARKLLPERHAVSTEAHRIVTTQAGLESLVAELRRVGRFTVDLDLDGDDPLTARWVGASFAWTATDAAYVPLQSWPGVTLDPALARAKVGSLLADPGLAKTGHDIKRIWALARRERLPIEGFVGDVMLLDYVLVAHERSHSLIEMANRHLAHTMSVANAAMSLPFARPLEELGKLGTEAAQVGWALEDRLVRRLEAGSRHVYEEIEVPLTRVLADMEGCGIRLALERLDGIRADIDARLAEAERRCHEVKGRPFNVNSRHEVAEALFGDGTFTPTKKVKDGWSTDASVLEKLADGGNLPSAILAYRQLQKLKGTYVDKLPSYVAADGRIHTHFNQAVAATGRLSSDEPNLQNIPIRTFEGRRVRDCFVPDPGFVFLSADYSQIELRILAHLTGEEALVESFRAGEDIHRRTASEVFGIDLDRVTFEQRNAAKAINFGLMYGMSSFRLSNDLQISREDAEKYMDTYFQRLPRVAAWIEETKAVARKVGFVETAYGRRRILPTMHAPNYADRMAAEREAVNSRVQGTAADIIKIAMLRVWRRLRAADVRSRMLLQVHDELLLEVPLDELDRVRPWVVADMESAAELLVPLRVNSATGATWNEAHG